ncbi:MAG: ABC transporter permease [Methylococcales bacterium]|nr:ABC transporter permease [Methylococcales bacterium]
MLLRALLAHQLWRHRVLLVGMVQRALMSGFAGASLGGVWLYLKPLAMAAAYYFVFDRVLSARIGIETGTGMYALYLMSGLIGWMAFAEGVIDGALSLSRDADLLKKTQLPFELIPARSVLTAGLRMALLVELVWLAGLFLAQGQIIGLLYVGGWFLLQLWLTYYLALSFACLSAALRDIGLLVEALFPFLLFFSPVLYQTTSVPETFAWVLPANPFSALADGYHHILLQGHWPPLATCLQVLYWLMPVILVAHFLYARARDQLTDWL